MTNYIELNSLVNIALIGNKIVYRNIKHFLNTFSFFQGHCVKEV